MKGFIIVGENMHTSRVVRKAGQRYVIDGDREWIRFTSADDDDRMVEVPRWARTGQDYEEGRIKHVRLALEIAMREEAASTQALEYLGFLARRQEDAGASFLDVNVDEISPHRDRQRAALTWLIPRVQTWSAIPVSVDSSSTDLLAAGLELCDPGRGRPLLNSASLERLEALDLAISSGSQVVVTASGAEGMPQDADQRMENIDKVVDAALSKGIQLGDLYVDPLIFPISVDGAFGRHALEAIRRTREEYGSDIHITGGFSNVSFGLPARSTINDVFLHLAIEAGADSGIVDPVSTTFGADHALDTDSPTYRLAEDVLMGRDEHCARYINAWRNKELDRLR